MMAFDLQNDNNKSRLHFYKLNSSIKSHFNKNTGILTLFKVPKIKVHCAKSRLICST